MLQTYTATRFGSYRRSHHQADKVPKKSYVNRCMLFDIARSVRLRSNLK